MAKLINWEIEKRKIKITNKRDYVVTNEWRQLME